MTDLDIQSNLKKKKLQKINQGSNFFGGRFSNRDYVRATIQFRRESLLKHPKRLFFSLEHTHQDKQRTTINSAYSLWKKILFRVHYR